MTRGAVAPRFDAQAVLQRLPSVARLYTTGSNSRRYRRASTQSGPGDALVERVMVERELARIEVLFNELAAVPQWLDVATAPRDGTVVLLRTHERLPRQDLEQWEGLVFVGSNRGGLAAWSFAGPAGSGGFPDSWIAGWMPLHGAALLPTQP